MYFIYDLRMRDPPSSEPPKNSLSVELGGWFKAHATGLGVIAIPLIVFALAAAALLGGA